MKLFTHRTIAGVYRESYRHFVDFAKRHFLSSEASCEDLVSEVFEKFVRSRRTMDFTEDESRLPSRLKTNSIEEKEERQELKQLLYISIKHQFISTYTRGKKLFYSNQPVSLVEAFQVTHPKNPFFLKRDIDVAASRSGLTKSETIVWQYFANGDTRSEIAQLTNTTVDTVNSHLSRIMKKIEKNYFLLD